VLKFQRKYSLAKAPIYSL